MAWLIKPEDPADPTEWEVIAEDVKLGDLRTCETMIRDDPNRTIYIEMVCPVKSPGIIFLCDEDGAMKGLPINPVASELYGGIVLGKILLMTREEGVKWGWIQER
jgi:hypothetical protein